ncbi:hypothetical protein MKX70_20945 [Paenibacillus sp. FSL R7-0312]|uniref:hypothetical protein n=1 Tax=Paenibacillus sp. FSL R7-0312 TaxID=2921682 RepID=UPI0030FC9AA6
MEQTNESIRSLIKKSNKSSGSAAIGNTGIAIVKGIAFALTGSGSMFATMMHSIADAVNGRYYHVEGRIELKRGLTLADADDIKFKVRDKLLADPHISDVTLGILEDNGIQNWVPQYDLQ